MFKQLARNILLREKASSEKFVAYLKKQGIKIGDNVYFYAPTKTFVDVSAPWLLSIGDNVNITRGVIILTHDYSWSVLKRLPNNQGRILGAQSPVKIGNNVFIGMNAIITRGVNIGDNVVIGAGSVVTKDCESDSVYSGVPAKKIMSISEYYKKREGLQFEEAKKIALAYKDRFGKAPEIGVFREYFMLFCTAEQASKIPDFHFQMSTGSNYDETVRYMNTHPPMFDGYSAFLEACFTENDATTQQASHLVDLI